MKRFSFFTTCFAAVALIGWLSGCNGSTSSNIDAAKKDAAEKDAAKKDAAETDTVKKDTAKKDAAEKDAAENDTDNKDAAKKDAAKKDAAKKDADSPTPSEDASRKTKASAGELELKWSLTKGEKVRYKVTDKGKLERNGTASLDMDTVSEITWSVVVDESGKQQISSNIDRVIFKARAAPQLGGEIEYDSQTGKEPEGLVWQNLGGLCKAQTASPNKFFIDAQGNLSDFQLSQAIIQAVRNIPQGASVATPGSIRVEEQAWIIRFPDHPLKKGDSWSREDVFQALGATITKKTTFTYQGAETHQGRSLHKITFKSDADHKQGGPAPPLTFKSMEESGHALFDAEKGKLVEAHLRIKQVNEAITPDGPARLLTDRTREIQLVE